MYIVYTKDNCTYCDQAKTLLTQKGMPFKAYKLGEDISRDELIAKIPTARTMPQIMKEDRLVGGFMELRKELLAA
jgi:glutaredoxin